MKLARIACLAALSTAFAMGASVAQETSRGEYLARAGNCVVCHTVSEGEPFAGGLKMNTPLGAIYTTNITPDRETGIGAYSYEEFDRALRNGVARDGHRLYPAMPYPSYARTTDEDSRALYDYFLKVVKPVRQNNTANEIASPWDMRWPLAMWNLVGGGAPYKPDPAFDAEWNRGAYLVQGLGHCGACHTPRGWLFQEKGLDEKSGAYLSGANLDNWSSPNLRGDLNTGLGRWTLDEIAEYLKTGHNRYGTAFGSMRDVVQFSTSTLADDDTRAIAKYLRSLSPSIDRTRPVYVRDGRTEADLAARKYDAIGSATYARQCASCHGLDGMGGGNLPALAGNPAVLDPDPTSLLNIVLNGAPSPASDEGDSSDLMPQFRTFLKDAEIADVISFIRSGWGNRARGATTAQAAALRKATSVGGERTIIRQMR
jgi:mono/diheme cytochrome c family protein